MKFILALALVLLPFGLVFAADKGAAPEKAAPADAAPCSSILHRKLTVAGTNDEWAVTGLKVQVGDTLLLLSKGRVKFGPIVGEMGAAGNGAYGLEMKIGPTGTPLMTADKF